MKKSGFVKGVTWTLSIIVIFVIILAVVGVVAYKGYEDAALKASYSTGKSKTTINIEKKKKTTSEYASTELSDKTVNFTEDLIKNKKKLKFKEYGPFYGIKKKGIMVRGIHKGPKSEDAQTDYYGLFTKNNMYWKGYSKHTYNDGKVLYQYNEYKLDDKGNPIQDKDGIFQLVDSYLISADSFEKVKEYIHYDIELPFSFYDFEEPQTQIAKTPEKKEDITPESLFESSKTINVFGIEGINIGDNLLEYFEKQELVGMEKIYDEEKKLTHILISSKRFETYDQIQATYRKIDRDEEFGSGYEHLPKEFLWIKSISGIRHYPLPNSYESCKLEKDGVVRYIKKELERHEDFKKKYKDKKVIYRGGPKLIIKDDKIHPADESGKSKFSTTNFILEDGGSIKVACYNWSEELTKKNGWVNALTVSFDTVKISTITAHQEHLPKLLFGIKETIYASTEKYYALIIGNNNYEHLEKLDAAENDAKVLANILQDKYGFEVELLLNSDYDKTVNSLFAMTNKLKENDNLLIYYAGHGEYDKNETRGYWLPVDASYDLRSKWISNTRIVDRIKATKAKHVLLMVDSCFSGTLMRSGITSEVKETIDEKYIERLKKKKTRLVITSGGNEPVVDSDGGQHSLFALKLIDTLKNNNSIINSQILFENIRRYVVSNADQTPERAMVHKTGHDGGDFLFFAKN